MISYSVLFQLCTLLVQLLLIKTCYGDHANKSKTLEGRPRPLGPLNSTEIAATVAIIKDNKTFSTKEAKDALRFLWITLKEPQKSIVLPYFFNGTHPGGHIGEFVPRRVHVFLLDGLKLKIYEIVINLDRKKAEVWHAVEDINVNNSTNETVVEQPRATLSVQFMPYKGKLPFQVDDNIITWQNFRFRVGYNAREGMVLYTINYRDGERYQPLFYRLSIADIFVHYGRNKEDFSKKEMFNVINLALTSPLECVGKVRYFDYWIHDDKGIPYKLERVICVREENAGVYRNGMNHRLVLSFLGRMDKYEYEFSWSFYPDARIEFNAALIGCQSKLDENDTDAQFSNGSTNKVEFNDVGAQHFFTLRIDMDIAGPRNRAWFYDHVLQNDSHFIQKYMLKTAKESMQNIDAKKGRIWVIRNLNYVNNLTNEPMAYKFIPWNGPEFFKGADSQVLQETQFLNFSTWIIPYNENQLYPEGAYLDSVSVVDWVKDNEDFGLGNKDLVMWHNLGMNHIYRIEDWPGVPIETCGITLKPNNFFMGNPMTTNGH